MAPEYSDDQVYYRVVAVAAAVSTLFSALVGPEVRSEVLAVAVAAVAEEVEVLLYAKLWMEAVVVAAVEEEVGVLLSAKLWMKVVAAEAEVVVVLVTKMSKSKDQATALQFSEKERQRVLSGPKRSSLVKVRTYSRHYHRSRNGRYHSDQIV